MVSDGRYRMVLPQNYEAPDDDAIANRNSDFRLLMSCDLFLGNFDGVELDSGTVAEFCTAKFLDMPALLLRTDFRGGGERSTSPDPWNFMCSGYPRTKTLLVNSMQEFLDHRDDRDPLYAAETAIAKRIVPVLDELCSMPSVLRDTSEDALFAHYRMLMHMLGSGMENVIRPDTLRNMVCSKRMHGIYEPVPGLSDEEA